MTGQKAFVIVGTVSSSGTVEMSSGLRPLSISMNRREPDMCHLTLRPSTSRVMSMGTSTGTWKTVDWGVCTVGGMGSEASKYLGKYPMVFGDVVSGKWGGRGLEEYQGLVKRAECRGIMVCVGRAYAHVYYLAHYGEPQKA